MPVLDTLICDEVLLEWVGYAHFYRTLVEVFRHYLLVAVVAEGFFDANQLAV